VGISRITLIREVEMGGLETGGRLMAEILKEVGAVELGKEVYAKLGEIFPDEKLYCEEVVKALEELEKEGTNK